MTNTSKSQQGLDKTITDDAIFKVTKEVVVKFIEVGRLTPDGFAERFADVYTSIKKIVRDNEGR